MEEMERDFVTFTDDDGNDFELDVIDYFEYEGQEYAVLMDLSEECEHGEDEECDCGHDVLLYQNQLLDYLQSYRYQLFLVFLL